MSNDLLSAALATIRAGVSIIPIDHQTKRPAANLLPRNDEGKATWKPHQERIAREAEVHRWCMSGIRAFAVVCGKVSGGLLVLDFDAPGFYEQWTAAVGPLANGLPVQQTGGGGYQVLLRCPDPGGNDKLAWSPDDTEPTGRTVAIETRAEGGYAVVAPSLHPSGNRYKWLAGDAANVPTVAQEHADKLLMAARLLDAAPITRQEQERFEAQAREAHQKRQSNGQASVIDAFNQAYAIEHLLDRNGYAKGPKGRYIRPGGKSASISVKDGRSCHWSSDDPMNDGRGKGGCGCHDAFDVYAHYEHGGDVGKAVKAAADLLGMKPAHHAQAKGKAEANPAAAPAVVEPYRPFPVEALPGPLCGFVAEFAAATGNDPASAALAVLVTLAGTVGNRVAALVKRGWVESAVLWGAIVGRSGTTKSAVLKLVKRPLVELYKQDRQQFAEDMAAYQAEQQRYEVERDRWRAAQKKGDGLSDPPVEQDEPTERRLLVSDVTCEKLGVLLQDNPLGLLLVRDELAAWIGGFDRYAAGGKGSDAPTWLSFFDAESVTIDRKSAAGTIFVERAAVSVLGSIQPGTLRRVFGAAEREAGLLARLLLVQPPARPVVWTDEELSDYTATAWADLLRSMMQIQPGTDDQGKPRPRLIPLAADAKAAYVAWHDAHGLDLADIHADDLAAHFAKLKGICIRLGLLLACVDAVTTRSPVASIGRDHIERAIAITDWFKNESRRVYSMLVEDDDERARRRLVELIARKGGSISGRELVQSSRAYTTVDVANAALKDLAEHGYGTWQIPAQTGPGGPKAYRFILAPFYSGVYSNPAGDSANGNSVDVDIVDIPKTDNSVDVDAPEGDGGDWGEV